jgi:dipeptide/tripeptide permease
MRGGAIPILAWGTILLVLAIGNWVWDDKTVNGAAATAAVVIIYGFGVAVWLARRDAIRRGPPEPRTEAEAVPQASLAAMLIGLSVGCALFGLAWAKFLLYLGVAAFVASVGRLIVELRAERATRRRVRSEGKHQ